MLLFFSSFNSEGPSTICAHIGWATLQFPFEVPHTTIRLSILTASVVGSLYYGMSPPGNERTSPRTKRAMFVYFGKVHGLQTPNSIQFFCDIFVSVFGMLVKIPMFGTKRKRKRLKKKKNRRFRAFWLPRDPKSKGVPRKKHQKLRYYFSYFTDFTYHYPSTSWLKKKRQEISKNGEVADLGLRKPSIQSMQFLFRLKIWW